MAKSLTIKQARRKIRHHVQAFICPYEPSNSEEVTRFYQLVPFLQLFPDADLDDLCCQVLEAIVY